MNINEIKEKLKTADYDFLRSNVHLGGNIMMLALGGSYSYGTNTPGSDLDVRGCAVRSREEILLGEDFQQVTDTYTDTTIYSFDKLVRLLSDCNPNTIEILGLRPDHYLYLSEQGRAMIENRSIFLSLRCVSAFAGYAQAQFRRLDNKSGRIASQPVQEEHILGSILRDFAHYNEMYYSHPEDAVKLYIDKAVNPELETEIFADIHLTHYPLRDYKDMIGRMAEVIRDYSRLGKRNKVAITKGKLGKHMMHCLRLYMMCLDILEKQDIITYRSDEHDLLMDIRNGKFLDSQCQPTDEFFDICEDYRKRLEYAAKNTSLPENPDFAKIRQLVLDVNSVAKGGEICSIQ